MSEAEEGRPARLFSFARWQRHTSRLGWFLSEFLIVVIGVLVAITIDGWWQDRLDREREATYLQQLADDLAASEAELVEVSAWVREFAEASARVSKAFWDPTLREGEQIIDDMIRPRRSLRYLPTRGTARALVNSGSIDLVRSSRLRGAIVSWLEDIDEQVAGIRRFDETYFRPAQQSPGVLNRVSLMLGYVELNGIGEYGKPETDPDRLSVLPRPAQIETMPFEFTPEAFFASEEMLRVYDSLNTAHRNQHFIYERMLDATRELLAVLADEGITPAPQP